MGTEASGQIILGAEVRINRGTTLVAYDSIEIGNQTLIGEFVSIRDANHGISPNQPVREQAHEASAIKIGRDVWIGRGSVILPGVEIGDHSIIGANSVVSKSIPPGSIAVGSPAKPIRKR
ncbi:MAG: acyltransferase [FCB group bacterium]|nr:acyltransferase [FCB group bacterium]